MLVTRDLHVADVIVFGSGTSGNTSKFVVVMPHTLQLYLSSRELHLNSRFQKKGDLSSVECAKGKEKPVDRRSEVEGSCRCCCCCCTPLVIGTLYLCGLRVRGVSARPSLDIQTHAQKRKTHLSSSRPPPSLRTPVCASVLPPGPWTANPCNKQNHGFAFPGETKINQPTNQPTNQPWQRTTQRFKMGSQESC